jgi:hypothetical protein
MKDKKLDKLVRQVSGQAQQKTRKGRFIDPTLQATRGVEPELDEDLKQLFKEMKRREF